MSARGRWLTAFLVPLVLAGCARDGGGPKVPVACKEGSRSIQAALQEAPGEVSLAGTRISQCFAKASDSADIQLVGASVIDVSNALAAQARAEPNGDAAMRLGYLMGAVERGASRTQGIHDELRRRIRQELIGVNTNAPAYREGERAGRERG